MPENEDLLRSAANKDLRESHLFDGVTCPKCHKPLRLVLQGDKVLTQRLCVFCAPLNGICPICGKALRTNQAEQCPHCKSRWHSTQESGQSFQSIVLRDPSSTVSSEPEALNPREFEQYVQSVIAGIGIGHNARIYRNVKYPGKRQPGSYEIDIALEFVISEALFFLVIVECKNWNRPVDRPVIQKLVQTRDAISAQKAVVVSAAGFTWEARAVAKTNGVALWVLGMKAQLTSDAIVGAMHEKTSRGFSDIIAELQDELYSALMPYIGLHSFARSPGLVNWGPRLKRNGTSFVSSGVTLVQINAAGLR